MAYALVPESSACIVSALLLGGSLVIVLCRQLANVLLGRMEDFSVRGVHCVVTGGSSGIGKEVAKVGLHCAHLPTYRVLCNSLLPRALYLVRVPPP